MENNGKNLRRKRKKRIHIRYFFITNRVKKVGVSVFWCPTGGIIEDYTTKQLQGTMLQKFRDQIMGVVLVADTGPVKVKVEQLRKV